MIAMRAYWILPNRDQQDEILASDGETMQPLRQILDPRLRPDGFSHGVPTELLEKCGPTRFSEILFAQRFPGWNGDQQLFSISTVAGLDATGRIVHLGLLFVLEPHERPSFELSYAGLSEQDKEHASALIHRLTSAAPGDVWVQSVRDLAALPSDAGPATNVALQRSVVRFDARYVVRPGGSIEKAVHRMKWTALLLLLVLVVLGSWLSLHAKNCSVALSSGNDPPRTVALTGGMTWRFN